MTWRVSVSNIHLHSSLDEQLTLVLAVRAMFCMLSSERICIAAGELKICREAADGELHLSKTAASDWTHIGSLTHEFRSVDFSFGSNDLGFTDALLRGGRRELLLEFGREGLQTNGG